MKIIIDTDPGIDDAFAIAYALHHPDIEVLGLTASFGNGPVEQSAMNARYLCHLFGHPHVPVALGSNKPYKRPGGTPADFVHGKDGLGNTFEVEDVGENHPLDAADFIIDQLRKHPGEITLVCIARLVNIATALEREPNIIHWVKNVLVMGGAIAANGNVTPASEANFIDDPEAAEKVMNAGWPLTLFPLDLTDADAIPRAVVGQYHQWNRVADYLARISTFYQDFYHSCKHFRNGVRVDGMVPHDLYPVIYLNHPEFFEKEQGSVYVHTQNDPLLGSVTLDRRPEWSHAPEPWASKPIIDVCMKANHARVFDAFHQVLENIQITTVHTLQETAEAL